MLKHLPLVQAYLKKHKSRTEVQQIDRKAEVRWRVHKTDALTMDRKTECPLGEASNRNINYEA